MATQLEEQQAIDFLKRAEIRTMKKDLRALREVDALKERDRIVRLKTLEEQLAEKKKSDELAIAKATAEKIALQEVLGKNSGEERIAEKDLKNFATEQERQQIFLIESQRLGFEKQVDEIDGKRDPALKLQKNDLLILRRTQESKLATILDEEKKLEDEQKLITEQHRTTTVDSQRKALEQTRVDLDEKIRKVEQKRWVAEKEIQDTDVKISQIDKMSEVLVIEKNTLKNRILGADRSLREIYSVIIAREEERRRGIAEEQLKKQKVLAETRLEEKEKIQREQWSPTVAGQRKVEELKSLNKVPQATKESIIASAKKEEAEREKFLQEVKDWEEKEKAGPLSAQVPIPPKK